MALIYLRSCFNVKASIVLMRVDYILYKQLYKVTSKCDVMGVDRLSRRCCGKVAKQ